MRTKCRTHRFGPGPFQYPGLGLRGVTDPVGMGIQGSADLVFGTGFIESGNNAVGPFPVPVFRPGRTTFVDGRATQFTVPTQGQGDVFDGRLSTDFHQSFDLLDIRVDIGEIVIHHCPRRPVHAPNLKIGSRHQIHSFFPLIGTRSNGHQFKTIKTRVLGCGKLSPIGVTASVTNMEVIKKD